MPFILLTVARIIRSIAGVYMAVSGVKLFAAVLVDTRLVAEPSWADQFLALTVATLVFVAGRRGINAFSEHWGGGAPLRKIWTL
jgi:energy-converting hydrogenase Eha subunit B